MVHLGEGVLYPFPDGLAGRRGDGEGEEDEERSEDDDDRATLLSGRRCFIQIELGHGVFSFLPKTLLRKKILSIKSRI